jgi:Ribbon-helix-helix protein, copG family
MIRTQIQLGDEQVRRLKRLAAERGVSLAELIREGADRILADSELDERWERASALVGRYRDTATDVAANHDRYLGEAYLP